jgi:C_GCAxxG_C_C family probable redox protein
METSLEEARRRATAFMAENRHCGPSVLHVMLEAYGMDDETLSWVSANFLGGFARRRQAACGAVSSAAILLALREKTDSADEAVRHAARERAREKAGRFADAFTDRFGSLLCGELLPGGMDVPGAFQKFKESGDYENRCLAYVRWTVEKLYELDGE